MSERQLRDALSLPRGDARTSLARHVVMDRPVPGRPWRVVLHVPLSFVHRSLAEVDTHLSIVTILAVLIATALAMLASSDLSRALVRMVNWTRRVAQGELGTPLMVESEDEMGELSWSLNAMSRQLQDMIIHVHRTSEGGADEREPPQASHEVMESSDEQSSGVLEARA
jgi:methyl-accepting chemotaxis protein